MSRIVNSAALIENSDSLSNCYKQIVSTVTQPIKLKHLQQYIHTSQFLLIMDIGMLKFYKETIFKDLLHDSTQNIRLKNKTMHSQFLLSVSNFLIWLGVQVGFLGLGPCLTPSPTFPTTFVYFLSTTAEKVGLDVKQRPGTCDQPAP